MKNAGLVGLGICMVCLLAACQPFQAKRECSSIDDIKGKLDFSIILPEFVGELSEQEYDVKYYTTHTLKQAQEPELVTGFLLEIHSKNSENTGYKAFELGGANIERVQDAIEPYNFALVYQNSHVQVKKEVSVTFEDKEMVYSEYREFNYEDVQKQKDLYLPAETLSELDDFRFDTFYAYIVDDGIRYSIVLYGLVQVEPSILEEQCLDIARATFGSLFN